ncbi:MAG: type VI secretion system tip protein VgrG [Dehalococcoidales bacterium]|nr:type VI secretion system tip protein VgrG [Dehalococcoidales bacterium]
MSRVVTITILSEGTQVSSDYDVISIDIIKTANKVPSAEIVLADGDATKGEFPISNTDDFKPGKEIEIKIRYEGEEGSLGQDTTVFKGVIVRHGVRASSTASFLVISLKDKAVNLTAGRKNAIYKAVTDEDIITTLISNGSLESGAIASTSVNYKEMVQYYCTDWDFLLSRADINGHLVIVDDGKVSTMLPETAGSPSATFEYGIDEIGEFEIEANILNQFKEIESLCWDSDEQKVIDPQQASDFNISQGDLQVSGLSGVIPAEKNIFIHPVDTAPDEMKAWADAGMVKSRNSFIRGRISVPGNGTYKPGDTIEIKGIGDKFNGVTLVTGIRHQVSPYKWETAIQFGFSSEWFSRTEDIIDTASAGLLPAINGLHIGIVDEFEEDPDGKYRVKVKVPALNADDETIWARLATPDGGNTRGLFFRPETGDEVVLGFFNDDPRQAVILGSLYSKKNVLPAGFEITADNFQKGLLTKESLKLLFDDEKKNIELSTPAGNLCRISDEDKGIHFEDQNGNKITTDDSGFTHEDKNGNKITTDDSGITIQDKNGNKLVMDSNGINIQDKNGNKLTEASSGITVQAGQNVNVKGSNIKIEGSQVDIN